MNWRRFHSDERGFTLCDVVPALEKSYQGVAVIMDGGEHLHGPYSASYYSPDLKAQFNEDVARKATSNGDLVCASSWLPEPLKWAEVVDVGERMVVDHSRKR